MQFLDYKLNVKQADIAADGAFEGYASVFDTVDAQQERMARGAFGQTLARYKQEKQWPKMLWQHDPKTPIGLWDDMVEDAYGLFVRGRLLLDLHKGREAYALLKSGVVDGLSIGYLTKQAHKEANVRVLDQVDLFEVSLVTFMANPLAKVTTYKHWSEPYAETVSMMNRLKVLKRAMERTDLRVKNLILESFV
ncbi:peptidase U35 [Alphaproteobacteria bacterium]|nr:peptidase U35 [Alphaproteobacteria bacterium]GHS97783.1 peptidase U35 [Alphaproteobacteria bacterium]